MAERVLIVEHIPKERLAATMAGEGASVYKLDGAQARYTKDGGWSLLSHTFALREDESGVFTLLFERHTSYWESSQEEYIEEEG